MAKRKNVFIAWINFQRRAFSMQPYFNYKLNFICSPIKDKRVKVLDYLVKSAKTVIFLLYSRPTTLWIQLPPTPLLSIALLYKKLFRKSIIIADCHNALFNDKWLKYLKKFKRLNSVDLILVHNNVIKDKVIELGIDWRKLTVLETRPASLSKRDSLTTPVYRNNQVVMPCSFSEDEPLSIVFDAARKIPDIKIIITGSIERAYGVHNLNDIPSNVILTGYLSKSDYELLLVRSSAVIGLTTEDHIQLSVANEATGFEKPMILSNTILLKDLFYKGTIYVETKNASSIAEGILKCLSNAEHLTKEVKALKNERLERWNSQALQVSDCIQKLKN